MNRTTYDIVVAGGGLAGSFFAGVMARAGYGVLLAEREVHFRDRVRGESTFSWGTAEVVRCGLRDVFDRAGAVEISGVDIYAGGAQVWAVHWADDSIDGLPQLGYVHHTLQEAAFAWAAEQGATTLRPAKVLAYRAGNAPEVSIASGGERLAVQTRLLVGADGKNSAIRRWTGGESASDPEHHRMGGVLISGLDWEECRLGWAPRPDQVTYWFPVSDVYSRIFLAMPANRVTEEGVTRSFERLVEVAAPEAPAGRLDGVVQEGPIAFYPNQCTWATAVSGAGVTLIGDAAGSPDPTQGHGTAQLFRDIRVLSELLIGERDWQAAIEAYARHRSEYFDVLRAYDRWQTEIGRTEGPAGDRLREGRERALAADPTLGGWNLIEARGPDGLVADEAARRRFFGIDE